MVYINNDTYDTVVTMFEEKEKDMLQPGEFVPTPEALDSFFIPGLTSDKDKLLFLLFVDAQGDRTEQNAEYRKYLKKAIQENVRFISKKPIPSIYISEGVYDEMMDMFDSDEMPQPGEAVPTEDEMETFFTSDIATDRYKLMFLLYIDAQGTRSRRNAASRKNLGRYIRENVRFVPDNTNGGKL